MKKWLVVLFTALTIMLTPTLALAENNQLKDEVQTETATNNDALIIVLNSQRTLKIKTYSGSDIELDEKQTIRVFLEDEEISIPIKGKISSINGRRIPMDSTALILNGDIVTPLKFDENSSEREIEWHRENQTISIFTREYLEKTSDIEIRNEELTGKGVKVAVIDSGIANHNDFEVSGGMNFINSTRSYEDDNGHGTGVAGVIASKEFGIAPGVELYSLKVLGENNRGVAIDLIKAVEWAITNNMDIINMSIIMDSGYSLLDEVIKKAIDHDIIVVACAGNNGQYVTNPASISGVISVGALSSDKKTKASFSSYIGKVDYMAIGEGVYSSTLMNKYDFWDGTSFASPYVAGIFALYKEVYPELNAEELKVLVDKQSEISKHDINFAPSNGWKIPKKPIMEEKEIYVPIKSDKGTYIGVKKETTLIPALL